MLESVDFRDTDTEIEIGFGYHRVEIGAFFADCRVYHSFDAESSKMLAAGVWLAGIRI